MKKMHSFLAALILGLGAMMTTSCDEDQMIGMSLEGTWAGNMYMIHEWSGHQYKVAESEITFSSDPFRTTRGSGYWIDYFSGYGWDYAAYHIRWQVINGAIRVLFAEDNSELWITDFAINNNFFEGYVENNYGELLSFRMRKVFDAADRNWNDYNYGWGYWDRYYSKATRSVADGKEFNMIEESLRNDSASVRHIRKVAE